MKACLDLRLMSLVSGMFAVASCMPTNLAAAAPATIFQGPTRQGVAKDGIVHERWGVEQTMLFEDGVFKSWYHGAPDSGGDYWHNPVIRYATSPDGIHWTDHGVCVGNSPYYRACHFVWHLKEATRAGEPAGYYMPVGRNGQFGFDLFYSTTGLPGSWNQLNDGKLILALGPADSWDEFRTGNICIWYENQQWQVMYEAADVPPVQKGTGSGWFSWRVGYAYGPSLTKLTKHPGNPVMFNSTFSPTAPAGAESVVGGPDVHKVGDTYYAVVHETDPLTRHMLTPTSCALYKSKNLTSWERLGWMGRIWVNKGTVAQVADGSLLSVNGKTYLWYEDQPDQSALLPSLGLMTWDMPFEDLVKRPEFFEDTEAGGWKFEPGCGEVSAANGGFPTTYFRKLNAPISPHCIAAKTDANHELRVRKPVAAGETAFTFAARAEQTDRKFAPLRIDADATDAVLAGVIFDADGHIKYHHGASLATARAYEARKTYHISYVLTPSGYALRINDELVAEDIPYPSAYAAPAFFKLELAPGAAGYVGTPMNPLPE